MAKNKNKGPAPSPAALRIGKRYRASRVDDDYDALVVGSGPGGLASAVCLAKMGWKVAVFEQHYTAGGFTHAYGRHGYEWDVGVHYVGDMGSTKTLGRKLFDFLSDRKLRWADMGEIYDTVYLGEEKFEFPKGEKPLRAALLDRFPEESAAIDEYFQLIRSVAKAMRSYSALKLLPHALVKPLAWLQKRFLLPKEMFETTGEVLNRLTKNKTLIGILTTQWGDSGLTPEKSSFIIHAVIARHYLNGGYYPVGGASQIAETQLEAIRATGGGVFTYARVDEILVDEERVTGVRMVDGHVIEADTVISGVGAPLTFKRLLPRDLSEQLGYADKLKQVQPSMAHLSMYIGVDLDNDALGLPKSNYWIYPSEHHDSNVNQFLLNPDADKTTATLPLVYISFPSNKDPSWADRYPGKTTIEIVAPAKFEWFAHWQNETWGQRGEDYEQLKEAWSQKLLAVLYERFPQLEGKIDYYELASPLSTQFFCEYSTGEIYGLDHTNERFQQSWLRPKTKIKGLYLTGQDTVTCGVMGGAMSGFMTAVAILGWSKGRELRNLLAAY